MNFGMLTSLAEQFSAMSLIDDGAEVAVNGAKYNAEVYRMAGNTSIAAANYNIEIDKRNSARQKDEMQRSIAKTFSANTAVQGASGFGFGSKSYLAVQAENISSMERQLLQFNNSAKIRQDQILWEGQVAQTQAENQARAAEYQGEVAQWQADRQQSQNTGKMIGSLISSFTGGGGW